MTFPLFPRTTLSMTPAMSAAAMRKTVGESHWLEIKTLYSGVGWTIFEMLIPGATAEEVDAIVEAINAPIERGKAAQVKEAA